MIFAPLAGRAEARSGRPSRPWISAPSRLVAIGALVLVTLVAGVGLATAFADSTSGYDVSYPLDFTPVGADLTNALYVTVFQGNAELANVAGTETPRPGHLYLSFTSRGVDPIVVRIQSFNVENLPPLSYSITPS